MQAASQGTGEAMRFIDLFAGIGGFRLALEAAGHTCVFSSEIDKHARATYQANHGDMPAGDITQIDAKDIPAHDILAAGFPCQSFSVAGLRKGFEDTRGTMFFEIARIVDYHRPGIVFLENVKGLVNHDKGKTLDVIKQTLQDMGYVVDYRVLNAKDFGLPQNRERIFIIARNDGKEITWPVAPKTPTRLGDILETDVDNQYYYKKQLPVVPKSDETILSDVRNGDNTLHSWNMIDTTKKEKELCHRLQKLRRKGEKDGHPVSVTEFVGYEQEIQSLCQKGIIHRVDNAVEFVNSKQIAGIQGIYRIYNHNSPAWPTITANPTYDYVYQHSYRKLTPRECGRLQGYPDSFIFPVSNSQAYKQLGNSVALPVVTAIAKQL